MLTILDLANEFGLIHYVTDPSSLKRLIINTEVDRCGMEVMGSFVYHRKDRLSLIGNKEMSVILSTDEEEMYQRFLKLCNPECPGIIICQGYPCPPSLIRAAQEMNCPVFGTKMRTSDLLSDIVIYLSENLAEKTSIHACLLNIFSIGVLLIGESGIGKSEISMELIKKGHRLIADDMVKISNVRDKLIGRAPESIYGLMEVRGIGIVDVARIFGINSIMEKDNIDFAIVLKSYEKDMVIDRLGIKTEYLNILGINIPKITLPVSAARNIASIIEVAVTNFKLKQTGFDSAFELEKRLQEVQESRKNKEK